MNSGATSERVYDALKRRLLSGQIIPGDKLEPAAFADQLGSSITPVRDALHRLAGERLVETRTSEGFHLPLVTEPGLRDLYGWNAQLVRVSLQSWSRERSRHRADSLPADLAQAVRHFFELFAIRSDNVEHRYQIDAINDRLAAPRAAEAKVLTDVEGELRELALAFDHEAAGPLLKRVTTYHRRRRQAAPAIVRAMYRS